MLLTPDTEYFNDTDLDEINRDGQSTVDTSAIQLSPTSDLIVPNSALKVGGKIRMRFESATTNKVVELNGTVLGFASAGQPGRTLWIQTERNTYVWADVFIDLCDWDNPVGAGNLCVAA